MPQYTSAGTSYLDSTVARDIVKSAEWWIWMIKSDPPEFLFGCPLVRSTN